MWKVTTVYLNYNPIFTFHVKFTVILRFYQVRIIEPMRQTVRVKDKNDDHEQVFNADEYYEFKVKIKLGDIRVRE